MMAFIKTVFRILGLIIRQFLPGDLIKGQDNISAIKEQARRNRDAIMNKRSDD